MLWLSESVCKAGGVHQVQMIWAQQVFDTLVSPSKSPFTLLLMPSDITNEQSAWPLIKLQTRLCGQPANAS